MAGVKEQRGLGGGGRGGGAGGARNYLSYFNVRPFSLLTPATQSQASIIFEQTFRYLEFMIKWIHVYYRFLRSFSFWPRNAPNAWWWGQRRELLVKVGRKFLLLRAVVQATQSILLWAEDVPAEEPRVWTSFIFGVALFNWVLSGFAKGHTSLVDV